MPFDPVKTKSIMLAKGMSNADLSRATGIAPEHVTRLLAGERGDRLALATVERVADALSVSPGKLLTSNKKAPAV